MMRSLFSGTSGLQGHQQRIDVIGNNISNVNTNGYKSSRSNFRTTILQTMGAAGAATGTRGSVNPKQIGLGTTTASIDPDFGQGSLETTYRRSDVALEGQGFFVLGAAENELYTRNGAFNVDQQGNLVSLMNGYYVQGWNADLDGVLDTTQALDNLYIPIGGLTIARDTTEVQYIGNLDAEQLGFAQTLDTEGRITTNPFALAAQTFDITATDGTVTGVTVPQIGVGGAYTADARTLDFDVLSAWTPGAGGDEIQITVTTAGPAVVDIWTPPSTYTNPDTYVADFVADWNDPLNWTGGTVLVYAVQESDTTVRFFEYDPAAGPPAGGQGTDSSFTFEPGPAGVATASTVQALGMSSGVYETMGASASPDPEYLALATAYHVTQGVPAPPAAEVTTDGNGQVLFTSTIAGLSGELILTDTGGSTAIDDIFGQASYNVDIGTYRTSVIVYDSLGVEHTINLDFNRQGESRVWEYQATDENGLNVIPGGATSGSVSFTSDGKSQTSGIIVQLNLTNGATTPQTIRLDLAELNQFAGANTVTAGDQDGVAMGVLENYSISTDGVITGEFTNGLNQTLGQLALATFNNYGGLSQVGTSLWRESVASGAAQVGTPESASRGKTVQGALEASNVDLATEFTQLIIGQRGYQANARVITTSDEILQELTNLKR